MALRSYATKFLRQCCNSPWTICATTHPRELIVTASHSGSASWSRHRSPMRPDKSRGAAEANLSRVLDCIFQACQPEPLATICRGRLTMRLWP